MYTAAQALGDAESQYLGLLPYAAWAEYASERRVICAVDSDARSAAQDHTLVGYVAFRLPYNQITLAHLVVRPDGRRHGVARALLGEVRRRFPERRGILVRCRRDYPADGAWPRLGFVALGNRPGRSTRGHLLTDWWFDFGHGDLLTWDGGQQTSIPVVMDANVFIALHGRVPNEDIVNGLSALEDRLELLVTPELSNEINRLEEPDERERLLHIAQQYPRLNVSAEDLERRQREIIECIGNQPTRRQDLSDLRHVAYTWSAGIQILVTDDRKARTRLRTCALELCGITVTNSRNLVAVLDDHEGDPAYVPRALKETGYALGETKADASELDRFIHTASAERRSDYNRLCDEIAARRPNSSRVVIRSPSGDPVGFVGVVYHLNLLEVQLIRVTTGPLQNSIAAQLVGHLRVLAREQGVETILIHDKHLDPTILNALIEDGYHRFEGGLVGLSIQGTLELSTLISHLTTSIESLENCVRDALRPIVDAMTRSPSPSRTFQIEHQLRPLRLGDQPLDTWLLPIKPRYAMDLFGYPPQLFDRPDMLGISREHVFFRGQKSAEQSPGRILWYASEPESKLFAVSSLVEVDDLTPRNAHRKYQRLGVYTLDRLEETADRTGHIRALRVTDTEILARPVSLPVLQRLAARHGVALQLWSATKIHMTMFADLMREAAAT